MAAKFGTIRVSANAIPFQTKSGFEIVHGGDVRTPIVGKDGQIHGYSVEHVAGSIEGTITISEGQNLDALFALSDADVQLEFDGFPLRIVVSGAEYTGPRSWSSDEGELALKINGTVTALYG